MKKIIITLIGTIALSAVAFIYIDPIKIFSQTAPSDSNMILSQEILKSEEYQAFV